MCLQYKYNNNILRDEKCRALTISIHFKITDESEEEQDG